MCRICVKHIRIIFIYIIIDIMFNIRYLFVIVSSDCLFERHLKRKNNSKFKSVDKFIDLIYIIYYFTKTTIIGFSKENC